MKTESKNNSRFEIGQTVWLKNADNYRHLLFRTGEDLTITEITYAYKVNQHPWSYFLEDDLYAEERTMLPSELVTSYLQLGPCNKRKIAELLTSLAELENIEKELQQGNRE